MKKNPAPKNYRAIRQWLEKADVLAESLPYMQKYSGATVVIKYGGSTMEDRKFAQRFCEDVVLLKQSGVQPVIVHGGGPQIDDVLARINQPRKFIKGLRVTDATTMKFVEMVLSGNISKQIVTDIQQAGGSAVSISGKDGNLIEARQLKTPRSIGFVGTPSKINPQIIHWAHTGGYIPVIAPLGVSAQGETYNINADTAAGALAASLKAQRLLILTDVPGVLDNDGKAMKTLTVSQSRCHDKKRRDKRWHGAQGRNSPAGH